MKNLQLQICEENFIPDSKQVSKFIQNPDDCTEVFVCDNLNVSKLNTSDGVLNRLCDISSEVATVANVDIVDLIFLSIERTILTALRTGEILLTNADTSDTDVFILEEFLIEGIKAIQLSPDQELIVILTNAHMYLLNSSLNVINKNKLSDAAFGECEFINVGWGKKETQFHGSEGKEAAKAKPQLNGDIFTRSDDRWTVSWRGDGNLYLVGFTADSQSTFKVYNREGVLQYTSERQPGVECNFAWRPSGNLIAATQAYPNKFVVAFFEKNGLKHGDFNLHLDYKLVRVRSLSWSGDSEILCVWYEEIETKTSRLLLYTSSNYHWYLKRTYMFPAECGRLCCLHWEEMSSSSTNKRLHAIFERGKWMKFEWVWTIDGTAGKSEEDFATVGVIDGSKVLLTSFKHSVVPPPMAAVTLEFPKNVNMVVFGPAMSDEEDRSIDSNCFIVVMVDGTMQMYRACAKDKYDSLGVAPLNVDDGETVKSALWLSARIFLLLSGSRNCTHMYVYNLAYEPSVNISIANKIKIDEQIVNLTHHSENTTLLQTIEGHTFLFSPPTGVIEHKLSFPECCYQCDAVKLDDEVVLFGLTAKNRFYIDDVKIANNISSYFVHSDFLMLTTLQHQLLCCPLMKKEMAGLRDSRNSIDDSCFSDRRIERGAKLVVAVPSECRTVLQMPRGNLEVVQPRALSLKIIGNHLDNRQYYKAFDVMRKQRINLNLIYDHDPAAFLNNVDAFISQIANTAWLSLFITELDRQDVTRTIYKDSYRANGGAVDNAKNVNEICAVLRKGLRACNEGNKNLLPILTTYAKNSSDFEKALLEIKILREEEKSKKSVVSSNEALKYLLYMVNVDDLYNIALGLDDFDLVMFVASKSQKDPKEYVPYLNGLMTLEDNYRKFTINKDLKRFELALKYLIACDGRDDELVTFVKQHTLYGVALAQIPTTSAKYARLAEEYGAYLEARGNYDEAGIMFKRSSNFSRASECFVEALDWRSSLFVAKKLNLSDEGLKQLETKLLKKLMEAGEYGEALALMEDTDASASEKISCALAGKFYMEALNVCLKHNQTDLLEKQVKPAIAEHCELLSELIRNNERQYASQKSRLSLVRKNKAEKLKVDEENAIVDCDMYSDTSSIMGSTTSKSSGRSYRSSKNRRKHERKLVSLKEGSRYEDIALVRALHTLIASTYDLRKDVSRVNHILLWFGEDTMASELQKNLEAVLTTMAKGFDEIWPPELLSNSDSLQKSQIAQNGIEVPTLENHLRIPPAIRDYKWKSSIL